MYVLDAASGCRVNEMALCRAILEIMRARRVLAGVMRIPWRRYSRYSNWNVRLSIAGRTSILPTAPIPIGGGHVSAIFACTSRTPGESPPRCSRTALPLREKEEEGEEGGRSVDGEQHDEDDEDGTT